MYGIWRNLQNIHLKESINREETTSLGDLTIFALRIEENISFLLRPFIGNVRAGQFSFQNIWRLFDYEEFSKLGFKNNSYSNILH